MKRPRLRSFVMAVVLLMIGRAVLAAEWDCEVSDPEGDALWAGTTDNIEVPSYQDIIHIEVRKIGRSIFTFGMDVAGEVPATPIFVPSSVKQILWTWLLDTDPATTPAGYPSPPGTPASPEFIVRIIWNGVSFHGELVDRRPLLTGASATVLPAPSIISGATLSVSVDSHALGDPESFRWGAGTTDWLANQQGNFGNSGLDRVPFTACPSIRG